MPSFTSARVCAKREPKQAPFENLRNLLKGLHISVKELAFLIWSQLFPESSQNHAFQPQFSFFQERESISLFVGSSII